MTKRSLLIAAASCFIVFAPAAYGRSAHDGSWDLVFVTQRVGILPNSLGLAECRELGSQRDRSPRGHLVPGIRAE
jgi:hypothetical protein